MKTTPFKNFYEVEYPSALTNMGFEDRSWHNDAIGLLFSPERKLVVWVDCEDPREREWPGEYRYGIIDCENFDLMSEGECETLFRTNDFGALVMELLVIAAMRA